MFKTLLVVGLLACSQAVPLSSKSAFHVSEAANNLGFALYQQRAAEHDGNVLVSPWSAHNALALAYLGAEGYTAKEMAHALQLENNKEEVVRGSQEIIQHWNTTRKTGVTLNTVNKVYPTQNAQIKDQYVRQVKQAFNASVEPIDFTNPEETARKINNYIEQNTNGHFQNFVEPDNFGQMTRLVLINALYFRGQWWKPFQTQEPMNFYQHSTSSTKQCPAMKVVAWLPYGYSQEMNAHVVQLPYYDNDYSLVLFVPQEVDGITNIEKAFPINMQQVLSQLDRNNVEVEMPKFHLSENIDLVPAMQKLGMRDAFTNKANFKSISDEELYLSKVVQKTYIEVDEQGTTEAGVSYPEVRITSAPIKVTANKPFLCVLYKRSANVALMVGRVSEPWY